MGDVQVMHSQSTEVKTKTKKVKKTTKQRRESDVQITEIEPTQEELERGYVSTVCFETKKKKKTKKYFSLQIK